MRQSSHFHAIRMAARLRLPRTAQPLRLRHVRQAPYPAQLPTRRAAAMQQQLKMRLAQDMLATMHAERQANGAFSPTYQATARRLLDTLFPDMAQHDPQWPARLDAALNDEGDGSC